MERQEKGSEYTFDACFWVRVPSTRLSGLSGAGLRSLATMNGSPNGLKQMGEQVSHHVSQGADHLSLIFLKNTNAPQMIAFPK